MMKERKAPIHEIMPQSTATPNNIVSLQAAMSSKGAKVVLIEPRVYAEAQDIAEHLKINAQQLSIYNVLNESKANALLIFKWYSLCSCWRYSTYR